MPKLKSDIRYFELTPSEKLFLKKSGCFKYYYDNLPHFKARTIYKFIKEERHADALEKGDVYFSTLGACRSYECSERGDPKEGTVTQKISNFSGIADDFQTSYPLAGRALKLSGSGNIRIENCNFNLKVRDGYVFCATDRFNIEGMAESFGEYCIAIHNPLFFQLALCCQLTSMVGPTEHLGKMVQYTERTIFDTEKLSEHQCFIKPKNYSWQREFRIFVTADEQDHRYQPHVVRVGNISRFIERVR